MAITRSELIRILAEADPVGLIAGGAPREEYAAEAEAILALHGIPTLTEITGIFAVSFSEPGRAPGTRRAGSPTRSCAEQTDEVRCRARAGEHPSVTLIKPH